MSRRATITVVVLFSLLLGCAPHYPPGSGPYRAQHPQNDKVDLNHSVLVMGLVSWQGNLRQFREVNYIHDLEAMIRRTQPGLALLEFDQARDRLDEQNFREQLRANYRRHGRLDGQGTELLAGARLPVKYVLLVTIEKDETTRMQPVDRDVLDQNGYQVKDRKEVVLRHHRTVIATGHTYDARSGRLLWTDTFSNNPGYERSYLEYTGSSFVGSVSNTLTNSFVHGRSFKDYPDAPGSIETTRHVLKRIAQQFVDRTF